ncbi:hypothetical protein CHARACLAT_014543 [Characodon lateralis]|uniref:Uncharacterized protein n=1 Tax=Characodon lateralis TaxID=208331 RepID=A0ABU7CSC8_9TELE|nr:hypothetical protein [Characodon lateralis]
MRSFEGSLADHYCRLEADWLAWRRTEKPLGEAGGGVSPMTDVPGEPLNRAVQEVHISDTCITFTRHPLMWRSSSSTLCSSQS